MGSGSVHRCCLKSVTDRLYSRYLIGYEREMNQTILLIPISCVHFINCRPTSSADLIILNIVITYGLKKSKYMAVIGVRNL